MHRILPFVLLQLLAYMSLAQRVLHFTRTSGFDHNTRAVSFEMFTSIGSELGVEVIDDSDGSTFSDLAALQEFDVIIFSNTSGNAILDQQQQENFQTWIAQGGNVLGIHAATDTYRHSSANGNNTGTWDFYAELIGGSVQEAPNHVTGTPSYLLHHLDPHPSIANLPDPWQKEEEYYYWENGYLHPQIVPVLEVEATIGPNGEVNSYDAPRPMSWYRVTPSGRVFYTALGHATSNYTSDPLFRAHVKDALEWLLAGATAIGENTAERATIIYDPAERMINISYGSNARRHFHLFDLRGIKLEEFHCAEPPCRIVIGDHANGMYILQSETFTLPIVLW